MCTSQPRRRTGLQGSTASEEPQSQHDLGGGGHDDDDRPHTQDFLVVSCTLTVRQLCQPGGLLGKRHVLETLQKQVLLLGHLSPPALLIRKRGS